jgi:hypothetical protein
MAAHITREFRERRVGKVGACASRFSPNLSLAGVGALCFAVEFARVCHISGHTGDSAAREGGTLATR